MKLRCCWGLSVEGEFVAVSLHTLHPKVINIPMEPIASQLEDSGSKSLDLIDIKLLKTIVLIPIPLMPFKLLTLYYIGLEIYEYTKNAFQLN